MKNGSQSLQTERLDLRRFTLDDADLMLAVWNDPDFVKHVGDRGIRTVDEARTALEGGILSMYADLGYGPYCVTLRGSQQRMGICGLFKREHLDDPDIGFGLLPPFRRDGIAWEAAVAVLSEAQGALDFKRVTAIVSPQNDASVRLIEKLGLAYSGPIRMPGDEEDVSLYTVEW